MQNFHKVSQALQSEDVDLQTCADLYASLGDQLYISPDKFERNEAKKMLPDVGYKAATTRKRVRKNVPNEMQCNTQGDAPDVYLNARDKFVSIHFMQLLTNLKLT